MQEKTTVSPTALTQPVAILSRSRGRGDVGRFLPNPKLKFLDQWPGVVFKRALDLFIWVAV